MNSDIPYSLVAGLAVLAVFAIVALLILTRSRQQLLAQQTRLRSELVQLQRQKETLTQELEAAQAQLQDQQQAAQQLQSDLLQSATGKNKLLTTVSDMTSVVEKNSITLAEVSWQAKAINKEMAELASKGMQMAAASQALSDNAAQVSANASQVAQQAQRAQADSTDGQLQLSQTIQGMRQMSARTEAVSVSMEKLQGSSSQIGSVVKLIREIAEKINLLSLNAAIEAARAGEHGRGFAVVADEVRSLAEKTHQATQEIDASVGGIGLETRQAVASIQDLLHDVQQNVGQIEQVGQRLNGILNFSNVLSEQMGGIVQASETSSQAVGKISNYLREIKDELTIFGEGLDSQERQIKGLTELSEGFFDKVIDLESDSTHRRMYRVARSAADAIQSTFEQAVAKGELPLIDLLSQDYQPIANTNPPQFRSRFDAFTDRVLPPIQEPLLQAHPSLVFAISTQQSGYVPTHNTKFAKPQTGNYAVDLVNSRSKRIFNDPTGSRCGSHTKKMLLQTYKRDTGEIMHDLSVPIYVQGKHWGGFRMGYRAD
jgi:methyl-accepting chemotaxis protein